jgi:hypothetical protein
MSDSMIRKNIEHMNKLDGFSVIIVCTSTNMQAAYWQQRLEDGKGSILPKDVIVLAVDEDWPGGAGNALGTLYAYEKAAKIAQLKHQVDILSLLKAGKISVGMYHTAGKGTRLSPLPGAENNNKPGVKLPATIKIGGKESPITILEAVIKQTGCYASSRPGRLSVFWGDQVFIPTAAVEYECKYHVDILCSLGPMVDEKTWEEKGMNKYGLIAKNQDGKTAQVEKVDHATAVSLLKNLGNIDGVGTSLGSFSVSWQMLDALLAEFSLELVCKKGKFDSDPHLWMPMTLEKDSYLALMDQKGISNDISAPHFDRIAAMMKKFLGDYADHAYGVFGAADVGQGLQWWDYGQLKLYKRNTLVITESTVEAELMRLFLGISEVDCVVNSTVTEVGVDSSSRIFSSMAKSGSIKNSVLVNVRCNHIEAENCVLMNVTGDRIVAKNGCVLYNVADHGGDLLSSGITEEGSVMTGVFAPDGSQTVIRSNMELDGGKVWDDKLAGNDYSFDEVYKKNSDADPLSLELLISDAHDKAWANAGGENKRRRLSQE